MWFGIHHYSVCDVYWWCCIMIMVLSLRASVEWSMLCWLGSQLHHHRSPAMTEHRIHYYRYTIYSISSHNYILTLTTTSISSHNYILTLTTTSIPSHNYILTLTTTSVSHRRTHRHHQHVPHQVTSRVDGQQRRSRKWFQPSVHRRLMLRRSGRGRRRRRKIRCVVYTCTYLWMSSLYYVCIVIDNVLWHCMACMCTVLHE